MSIKDIYFIIKRRIWEKRNIIFIIITIILTLALILCLEIYNIFGLEKEDNLKRDPQYKTIKVYKGTNTDNDYDKINDIEGIVYSVDINKVGTILVNSELLNKKLIIPIRTLLDKDEIDIVKGRNIANNNEAVCVDGYYPRYTDDEGNVIAEEYISKKDFIESKDLIGKSLSLVKDDKQVNIKVVGTFDAFKVMDSRSVCYVSSNVLDSLNEEKYPYTGRLVKVETLKDVKPISEKIKALGFEVRPNTYISNSYSKHIPIFVSILTIIISFYILYNFIKKKLIYHIHTYGILKASGYKNEDIFKIEFIENTIITTICFIISVIIFIIGYYIIINMPVIYSYFVFSNEYNYKIPVLGFLLVYLVLILLNFINSKLLMKQYIYKRNIFEVLEDK